MPLEIEISEFIESLKQKNLKNARSWLESKRPELENSGKFEKGYLLALNGMITSIEENQELSLMKKILNGSSKEELSSIAKDFKKRINQRFRPEEERGFDSAWFEVIQRFVEE